MLFEFPLKILTRIIFLFLIAGCVPILDATRSTPIETDEQNRSFGEYLDDQKLETVTAVNIKKASVALDKNSHVNVYAFKSVVLLTGEVPTELAKKQAGDAARKVDRARQVHNELVVGANSSIQSRTFDRWFEAKLKAKAIRNKIVEDDHIRIVVEDNVVYLMGRVSRVEGAELTELARTSGGIKKVVRVFDYVD